MRHNDNYDDYEDDGYKSRSQMKREMTALQGMGERLAGQSEAVLRSFNLPDNLFRALLDVRKMKNHEARRRQLQYVGTLMRDVDPEPIRAYLDDLDAGRRSEARNFHEIEEWRDRMVGGEDALVEELLERFPQAERQQFWQIVRNARKEAAKAAPPKSARALFRMLRELRDEE